jgi:DNA helicase-2/ATP-dependent DNA helicase PcrA
MIEQPSLNRALAALGRSPNNGQQQAALSPKSTPLFVVAGPGTGKTACLTMRILKLVLVDGVPPRGVLATTFTKKVAAELRSRILTWSYAVIEYLQNKEKLSKIQKMWLDRVDINQVRTGTIDSICEELLRDYRDPGSDPPVLADEFVAETLLRQEGLFANGKRRDQDLSLSRILAALDCKLRKDGEPYGNFRVSDKLRLVRTMWDRRFHDQIDWPRFVTGGTTPDDRRARKKLHIVMRDYSQELQTRMMVDFAQLEQAVLDRLREGGLKEFSDELKVILVDEYQDSNLLQESIYFELAARCGGALTVVGDDDQSLYRFRGATIDLFSDFEMRYVKAFEVKPKKVFLNENYRSTQPIIDFVNDYALLDAGYQAVRVAGKPPLVNPKAKGNPAPILGMFRNTLAELADDLATFIRRVAGTGYKLPSGDVVAVDKAKNGDVGDIALLCSSPKEYGAENFGQPAKQRLPLLLKDGLLLGTPSIKTFNPRGQDFASIPSVRRLGGLLLCCLDRNGYAEEVVTKALGQEVRTEFQAWATEAEAWLKTKSTPKDLVDFVDNWSNRNPGRPGYIWPKSTPAIDLLYALVHWMPELHDDPEGQIYLEVFTRQLAACEQVSGFKARVKCDPSDKALSDRSAGHLLQYFLGPIASGSVSVDEELIESFPRDRLSVLSIHQSKGLEFPLVIVDVGSDFEASERFPKGHYANSFKRFPRGPSTPHLLEDLMRVSSPLKSPARSGQDRAFDDLYRHFFVAFSRPQDVLLLVGLTDSLPPGGQIQNVAMGYDRNGVCRWAKSRPFLEI